MSKITLSVIVYAPCLNKTTIKTDKKQMISSADTFFWMTRYVGRNQNDINNNTTLSDDEVDPRGLC